MMQDPNQQAPQTSQQDPNQTDGEQAQGPEQLVEAMLSIRQALQAFGDSLGQSLPPEGMKALVMAAKAYDQFLTIAQKSMGVQGSPDQAPEAPMGQQSEMTAGKNAVPAGY